MKYERGDGRPTIIQASVEEPVINVYLYEPILM